MLKELIFRQSEINDRHLPLLIHMRSVLMANSIIVNEILSKKNYFCHTYKR